MSEERTSLEAWVFAALSKAKSMYHRNLLPVHFLLVLPQQRFARSLLPALVEAPRLSEMLKRIDELEDGLVLPKSQYGGYVGTGDDFEKLAETAATIRDERRDDESNVIHLFMALADGYPFSEILQEAGLTREGIASKLDRMSLDDDAPHSDERHGLSHVPDGLVPLLTKEHVESLQPVVGREREISAIFMNLARRERHSVVLVGENGTGRSSLISGVVRMMFDGDAPETFRGTSVFALDLGRFVSPAGTFQKRFSNLLEELQETSSVLVIENMPLLFEAGMAPSLYELTAVLSRPSSRISVLAKATNDEWRETMSSSPLADAVQPIPVSEPSEQETLTMLKGSIARFEDFYGVRVSGDAISAATRLSNRYIHEENLPAKAFDTLDEACASSRISLASVPAEVRGLRARRAKLVAERRTSSRPFEKIDEEIRTIDERISEVKALWTVERERRRRFVAIRSRIEDIRKRLRSLDDSRKEAVESLSEELLAEEGELEKLRKEDETLGRDEMTTAMVDGNAVAKVVERRTGIPLSSIMSSESDRLADMESHLSSRVIGQDKAVSSVSNAIRRSRAGVSDPNRPSGSFLFLGTSGSGKTLLSKELAKFLFDDADQSFIRIDMSEYGEKHSVSRLIGAPPGYVGYEGGGQLTEAVRKHPYSVILFDEVEKAHPEIFDILLQVLDDGRLTDGRGRTVDFRNTIIILTSNLGAKALIDGSLSEVQKEQKIQEAVRSAFRPEFINRLDDIIVFRPFSKNDLKRIVSVEIDSFVKRVQETVRLTLTDGARTWLAENGYDATFGARPLKRLIQREIGDRLALMLIEGRRNAGTVLNVSADVSASGSNLELSAREENPPEPAPATDSAEKDIVRSLDNGVR